MNPKVDASWQNPDDLSRPYAVLMRCGHVEMRRMRPSTAGKVVSPDGEIRSRELCAECFSQHSAAGIAPHPQGRARSAVEEILQAGGGK